MEALPQRGPGWPWAEPRELFPGEPLASSPTEGTFGGCRCPTGAALPEPAVPGRPPQERQGGPCHRPAGGGGVPPWLVPWNAWLG